MTVKLTGTVAVAPVTSSRKHTCHRPGATLTRPDVLPMMPEALDTRTLGLTFTKLNMQAWPSCPGDPSPLPTTRWNGVFARAPVAYAVMIVPAGPDLEIV